MKAKQLLFALIAGTFLFQFCSDNNPVKMEEAESTASKTIGTAGGSVETENGITLNIPQGALQQDTEIKVTSLEGNTFGELGAIGAKLEPDGLTFDSPATIQFPLPVDWAEDEEPLIYEASGSDPSNFLIGNLKGTVTGSAGAYFCEVEVSHFSSLGAARNCHAGTVDFLLDDFVTRGCNVEEMTSQVKESFGDKFIVQTLEKTTEFRLAPIPMQYFLDTYFNDIAGFEEGEPVTGTFFNTLVNYLNEGRQVVVAFGKTWNNKNNEGFYIGFDHSALLEIHNGQIKLRQSVSFQKDDIVNQLIEKNGKNVFWYPKVGELDAESINQFRESKTGVSLEDELCEGEPECLFSQPVERRSIPYPAARFYVSKYLGNQNPCETGNSDYTKCEFTVKVSSIRQSTTYYETGETTEGQVNGTVFGGNFTGSFSNNTFTGSRDEVTDNYTLTSSIIVELNETRDAVTKVHVSYNLNGNFSSERELEAINIPYDSSEAEYRVETTLTCDHITLFTTRTAYEDRETNMLSFDCIEGEEFLYVFFYNN